MKQRIVLDLDTQPGESGDKPQQWDWAELLNLGPNEQAAVVSCDRLPELTHGQVAVELRLRVVYDAHGTSTRALRDQLDALVSLASSRGLITGDLPAEVDSYSHQVLVTEHKPAGDGQGDAARRAERARG